MVAAMSRRATTRAKVSVWPLVVFFGAQIASAASSAALLRQEFRKQTLCATVDFDDMEVNVEDGIVDRSSDGADRVRTGERLQLVALDVSSDGMDVELELMSAHTRGRTVDVELIFYRPLRISNRDPANLDDFWKAVAYFTDHCEARPSDR